MGTVKVTCGNKNFLKKLAFETRKFIERQNELDRKKLLDEVSSISESDQSENLDISLFSEESFYSDSLSDLLTLKSVEGVLDLGGKFYRFSSSKNNLNLTSSNFIKQRRKKPKLDLEFVQDQENSPLDISTASSELQIPEPNKQEILKQIVIQKIKELRNVPSNLNNKKQMFGLVRKYKLIQNEAFQHENGPKSNLSVTNLHFVNIRRKVGQNDYFLVVSSGIEVQTSKFIKTDNNFVTFDDVFVFENCNLNFCIKVQLYVTKLNTKLKMMIRKAPLMDKIYEWYKTIKQGKNRDAAESTCFELLDEFDLTREDFQNNAISTIQDKLSYPKMFKYSLRIEEINIGIVRNGFLKVFISNESKWKRCWCVLSGTVLQIFSSIKETTRPILHFNLRYVAFSKIDGNGILFLKHVRPSRENDENEIALESRNHFVVIKHLFKAVNLRYLHLWMRDINTIIKTLDEWNFSFLYSSELEM